MITVKKETYYYGAAFLFFSGIWLGFLQFRQPPGEQKFLEPEEVREIFSEAISKEFYSTEHKKLIARYRENPKAFLPDAELPPSQEPPKREVPFENYPGDRPENYNTPSQVTLWENTAEDFRQYYKPEHRDPKSRENRKVLNELSENVLLLGKDR